MFERLQSHDFKWDEEGTLNELLDKYSDCKAALRWWTGEWECEGKSRFDVNRNKYLKDFVIINNPWFNISNKCCEYAKKNVAKDYAKNNGTELTITGVRKAEGGQGVRHIKAVLLKGSLKVYLCLYFGIKIKIEKYTRKHME